MKLRIKGNSIRIRLTKTEVNTLADNGHLEEQTMFVNNRLVYALQSVDSGSEMSASLDSNKVTIFVPAAWIKDWPHNEVIGFNSTIPVDENNALFLLLEKDFVCLDETTEDQSDHYQNPNKTC